MKKCSTTSATSASGSSATSGGRQGRDKLDLSAHGTTDYTFRDLEEQSNRLANVLAGIGFATGDVFFPFPPQDPEQFFAFLGTLQLQGSQGRSFELCRGGPPRQAGRLPRQRRVITRKSMLKKISRIQDKLSSFHEQERQDHAQALKADHQGVDAGDISTMEDD